MEFTSLMADQCEPHQARVAISSLNVRMGPGAGRPGEPLYTIQSYVLQGECIRATATNMGGTWVVISDTRRAAAEGGWVAAEFLDYGPAHAPLSSLVVVAAPPTPTEVPRPKAETSLPVGIQYLNGADYACYTIQGDDGLQLAEQIDSLGPFNGSERAVAVAGYRFRISDGTCYDDGTGDLTGVNVSLYYTITVPCWYPQSDTIPGQIDLFDRFMASVAQHELTHIEIAREHGVELESRLRQASSCSQSVLRGIVDQLLAEDKAAQEMFHASPEGQPITYPYTTTQLHP